MNTPQQRRHEPHVQPRREGFVEPGAGVVDQEVQQEPVNGHAGTPEIAAPDAPAETPPAEEWPVTVRLKKPIRNNRNELINEISFREPTGGDVNRYGNPCRVDYQNEIIIDDAKMIRMIAALSNILPPMIEQMDPRDLATCGYRLRGFFLPDPRMWVPANTKT